jgi:hypothetical protein
MAEALRTLQLGRVDDFLSEIPTQLRRGPQVGIPAQGFGQLDLHSRETDETTPPFGPLSGTGRARARPREGLP